MPDSIPETRHCPTREDGQQALIAHSIGHSDCQDRQRRQYHKCFTCAHRNGARGAAPKPASPPDLTNIPPPPRDSLPELRRLGSELEVREAVL